MSCQTSASDAFLAAQSIVAEHGDFELTGSIDSAKRYIAALTTMIPLLPQRQQMGGAAGESINWSIADLIRMRGEATKWLNANKYKNRNSLVGFCRYRT